MTDDGIRAFDALLDKTVRAPRLSGSKVKELTESALRQVAHDHDLVAALLKLNASLAPASAQRISSLYVFDAIARAAKSAAKGSSGGGGGGAAATERGHGTPASLLAKMEGAVGSLVEGMVDDGRGGVWAEGRDKTRKIVEIWKKGSTFPEACVAQLAARIAAATTPAGRSPAVRSPSAGPSKHQQAPGRSTTPTEPPPLHIIERYAAIAYGGDSGSGESGATSDDAPAQSSSQLPPEIMAMLGVGKPEAPKPQPSESNAALDAVLANVRKAGAPAPAAGGAQQSVPIAAAAAAAPNLDPAQLAALASLGATLGSAPQPPAAPAPAPPQPQPQHSLPAPPATLPPRPSGLNGAAPTAQGYGRDRDRRRSRSPDRWARRDSRDDRRHDSWDRSERDRVPPPRDYRDNRDWDRDHREYRGDRDRDRDQRGGGRDHRAEREYDHRGGGGRVDGRDFRGSDGRDARPTSRDGRSTLPPRPDGLPPRPTPPGATVPLPSTRRRSSPARGDRPGSRDGARGAPMAMSGSAGGGGGGATLDRFDWTTFNPVDGASWASLGEAWRASTGREPDQMELMQYMMTQMAGGGGDGASGAGAASMGSMGGMGGMGMGGMGGMGMGMGAMGMGGMGMGMGMNGGGAGMGNYQ